MRYDLQPPSDASIALAYVVEVLIRAREVLVTVFHDTPADLRDPARNEVLRRHFRQICTAIEQFQPAVRKPT